MRLARRSVRLLSLWFVVSAVLAAGIPSALAGGLVSGEPADGTFPLVEGSEAADIFVSAEDWKVARIAAADLAGDVERVTGVRPELKHAADGLGANAVLVGTIGKSPVIDGLIESGRLDVNGIRGQWESFLV